MYSIILNITLVTLLAVLVALSVLAVTLLVKLTIDIWRDDE